MIRTPLLHHLILVVHRGGVVMIMTMKGIRIGHTEDMIVPMATGAKMQEGELYHHQQDRATAAVDVGTTMQTMR